MSQHAFPYLNAGSFLREPARAQAPGRRYCVAGIAWDGAVTNRPGARFGPSATGTTRRVVPGGSPQRATERLEGAARAASRRAHSDCASRHRLMGSRTA